MHRLNNVKYERVCILVVVIRRENRIFMHCCRLWPVLPYFFSHRLINVSVFGGKKCY